MEMKKVIRGIKRMAAVLSAGAMVLPLTGCKANNTFKEKTLNSCLDEYRAEYGSDTVKNGVEMYEYVADLYSQYSKHAKETYYPSNRKSIKHFVGPTLGDNTYGPQLPNVTAVTIKTKSEPIVITLDNTNSYSVYTSNDSNRKKYTYTYNLDGSYSILEEDYDGGNPTKVQFDSIGLIEAMEKRNSEEGYHLYEYDEGDMNAYSVYSSGGILQEKRNKDGSYTVYDRNGKYERLEHNYDAEGNLKSTDEYYAGLSGNFRCIPYNYTSPFHVYDIADREDIHTIILPDGDSYTYVKYTDADGNYVGGKKISTKNEKYSDIVENLVIDGKNTTIVSRYDYNVPNPHESYDIFGEVDMGAIIYQKVDDKQTVKMKDGIIYHYDIDGSFISAEQVMGDGADKKFENGVMFYNEDGTKKYFENYYEGKHVDYDENGVITSTRLTDREHEGGYVETEYYGDITAGIKSVKNESNDTISVDANGQNFILGKSGEVLFYDDGQVESYNNTTNRGVTIKVKDNDYTVHKKEAVSFYSNGQQKSISNSKLLKTFYENGNIHYVSNNSSDVVLNESGYDLKKDSYLSCRADGELDEYFYDENYNIKSSFIRDKLYSRTTIKDGLETKTMFNQAADYDFENQKWLFYDKTTVKNIKEGSVVNVRGYDLKYGSSLTYDENSEFIEYIYDEDYTEYKSRSGEVYTIEKDGKKTTHVKQKSNGYEYTKVCEKPIECDEHISGTEVGLSGLQYTIKTTYHSNNNIKSIVSCKLPEDIDDGYTFSVNDAYGNAYEISRGSSIEFTENSKVYFYKSGKDDIEKQEER